jgi:hypothetical protein
MIFIDTSRSGSVFGNGVKQSNSTTGRPLSLATFAPEIGGFLLVMILQPSNVPFYEKTLYFHSGGYSLTLSRKNNQGNVDIAFI